MAFFFMPCLDLHRETLLQHVIYSDLRLYACNRENMQVNEVNTVVAVAGIQSQIM